VLLFSISYEWGMRLLNEKKYIVIGGIAYKREVPTDIFLYTKVKKILTDGSLEQRALVRGVIDEIFDQVESEVK
jgi:hypothetical protein